jgi:tRNA-2-methylthio-N6-dimethylallyladenosine synthase
MNKSKKRFFVQTYGCQMNVNDSEKVEGLLRAEGLERASTTESADVVFINTCAVRDKAQAKLHHSLSRLKRLKKQRPELRIAVGGCVAQLEGRKIVERAKHVDVLVGTHNLARVPGLIESSYGASEALVDLDRGADAFAVPPSLVAHSNPVRAYVTAMEGCNHVCSFCVVPRTRGPEVNRPVEAIVSEVEALVARGFPEVMLLGQTVNAYRHGAIDFAGLLARVHEVRGLRRLRFTTSHPEHVGERMAEAFRDLPRVCPYLHLPFQSGSDRVLASMRRGYDRAAFLERIALLRDRRPDLALSTDVIVGYPGETEAEFEETLGVLETVGFDALFAFAYSPRPGTLALRLPDDVPEEVKRRRLHVVNDRQQRRQRERNLSLVGSEDEVLFEAVDPDGRIFGRTPHFRIVHSEGPSSLVGQAARVVITAGGANSLRGRLAQAVH